MGMKNSRINENEAQAILGILKLKTRNPHNAMKLTKVQEYVLWVVFLDIKFPGQILVKDLCFLFRCNVQTIYGWFQNKRTRNKIISADYLKADFITEEELLNMYIGALEFFRKNN
ncbi:homeobox domain-containing protein [Vairimorpha necatrix]|uniref:Homeobox domain-containing protein n=1 Tax=Vairimorpha necatrix TaxID=6039 RepID=A0AAX4J873_9MICR